ncbi:MAG: arsenic metallochaperone ArsD family protein [Myxococcales bacterium]|nr:arsenic metallochaperone ArsD family protein [Myxococcales bacterium]
MSGVWRRVFRNQAAPKPPPKACAAIFHRLSADNEWLRGSGVKIERFNLAQEPGAFAASPLVKAALEDAGEAALPIVLVDGRLVMSGTYPTREQLEGVWEKIAGEGNSGRNESAVPTEAHRRRTQWYAEDGPTEVRPT